MSLTRGFFNDFEPLLRLVEDPRSYSRQAADSDHHHRHAVAEVSEEDKEYVVRAELPGVQKQDLDVHVGNDGRSLTIEGRVHRTNKARGNEPTENANKETSKDAPESTGTYEYRSTFSRTVWFPRAVDGKNARAKLEDGILTLNIPKREESGTQRISLL